MSLNTYRTEVNIVWLRRDLRLDDQPALAATAGRGTVVPVFVHAPEEEGEWAPGAAAQDWLGRSLAALADELTKRGSRLILRRGPSAKSLIELARESGAGAVFWNRLPEPAAAARDAAVEAELRAVGIEVQTFQAALLHEPDEPRTGQGGPYRVFTPYWRALERMGGPDEPLAEPAALPAPKRWPRSLKLGELGLKKRDGVDEHWQPGEAGARSRLAAFLEDALADYAEGRERPDRDGTSRLSPHLHWGEISARRLWHEVRRREDLSPRPGLTQGAEAYLRQLAWREFAHHLLAAYPATPTEPLRAQFARLEWQDDPGALAAWRAGRTGFPLVDAGMRQLAATGWMHNRVRMVAASLLVKDLLVPWTEGARWFWETLVDADLANNTLGWQWVAGCGADAAPFFRIFNPVLQGRKFDPAGDYVRRWLPELAGLTARWIHAPWEAPAAELTRAGVRLGENYPKPLVDRRAAQRRALAAYQRMKE